MLHLAEHLEVPLRERNTLLLAAGYAPEYARRRWRPRRWPRCATRSTRSWPATSPSRRWSSTARWDLVSANGAALGLITAGVAPHLLEPPVNALRVTLHPDGLAPRIVNFAEYAAHLLVRLHREAAHPGPGHRRPPRRAPGLPGVAEPPAPHVEPADLLFSPLRIEAPDGGELVFFSTLATFGTALDITLAELSIEPFFPADAATAAALRG